MVICIKIHLKFQIMCKLYYYFRILGVSYLFMSFKGNDAFCVLISLSLSNWSANTWTIIMIQECIRLHMHNNKMNIHDLYPGASWILLEEADNYVLGSELNHNVTRLGAEPMENCWSQEGFTLMVEYNQLWKTTANSTDLSHALLLFCLLSWEETARDLSRRVLNYLTSRILKNECIFFIWK